MNAASERRAVIIEDDPEIADLLALVLSQAGFQTLVAGDGTTGLAMIRQSEPMLTTLDINLPGMDGFEVVRLIRSFSSTYVIMLSARRDEIDTLTGLNAGADDYMAKPFRPRELRARVDAMIRRLALTGPAEPHREEPVTEPWLAHGGLRLNPSMRLVELDSHPVNLTRTEFDMLCALMSARRRVVSKDELSSFVRGESDHFVLDADRRSIETHMANLRRKLGDSASRPRFIETVRGIGYRLTVDKHS